MSEYYTYDANDQLVRVDSDLFNYYTSIYSYDSRGNVLSKDVYSYPRNGQIPEAPKETTTFTYANTGWKDRLVAVNDVELTYDEIGNVLTYGDKNYTWNSGRHLESITDGENTYSYTYDENGIRTSKTVNGVTTHFNTRDGVILSQTDGTNTIFFQYDTSGVPLGFMYNGSRFLYMTNQMGDVVGIADKNGDLVAVYRYDEWGKLLSIETAYETDLAVANANPLRYRGYYYDNETGYYYLQSRYYDPSICRFINADIPEIAKVSKEVENGINAFAYCNNNPVNYSDSTGMLTIRRGTLSILLDVIFDVLIPAFAGPVDIIGRSLKFILKGSKTYARYCDAINTLKFGAIPKVKGLYSKFHTKIRTAIWRVTGYTISNALGNTISLTITKLANIISKYKLADAIDILSCLLSLGGWIALIIDLTDGNFNGKCRLW